MPFASNLESVAFRFSSYIKDLHEFFTQQGVQFGDPSDLPAFAKRLESSPAFQDDIASLVRSFLYRESENVTPGELFEVLALAVAGQKIEDASQEYHDSVARIFAFVAKALRDRRKVVSSTPPAGPPDGTERRGRSAETTSADVLPDDLPRTLAAGDLTVSHSNSPNTFRTPAVPREEVAPRDFAPRFGGYGTPAVAAAKAEDEPQPSRPRSWWGPLAIAAVLILTTGLYLGRTRFFAPHASNGRTDSAPIITPYPSPTVTTARSVSNCFGSARYAAPPSSLTQAYQQVRDLKARKHYDEALVSLRDIAAADPGFPGINLEISDLALQLHHTQQARNAVSAQIAISECLATLPAQTLDPYCRSAFPNDAADTCHSRLAQTREAAQLQANLVTQELSRGLEGASPRSAQQVVHTVPRPAQRAVRPLSLDGESAYPREVRSRPQSRDSGLVEGQGTDSALGAYSKPQ